MKSIIVDREKGIVKVTPHCDKVAIVAGGASRELAPYDDLSWEIWGLNEQSLPRCDRWFEMHPLGKQTPREMDWLAKCDKPVYMLKVFRSIPNSVKYPFDLIAELKGARVYFACTMTYQVALAIVEGFKEIGLWGLSLGGGSFRERTIEKMTLEWWLGYAAGRGIKITTNKRDDLLYHPYLYGYEYNKEKDFVEQAYQWADWGVAVNRSYLDWDAYNEKDYLLTVNHCNQK